MRVIWEIATLVSKISSRGAGWILRHAPLLRTNLFDAAKVPHQDSIQRSASRFIHPSAARKSGRGETKRERCGARRRGCEEASTRNCRFSYTPTKGLRISVSNFARKFASKIALSFSLLFSRFALYCKRGLKYWPFTILFVHVFVPHGKGTPIDPRAARLGR